MIEIKKTITLLKFEICRLINLILLVSPLLVVGQVTFSRIPMDKQLVARDTATNIGLINVSGQVEYSGAEPDYVKMRIETLREGVSDSIKTFVLDYGGTTKANFDFSIGIEAEFANYSITIRGIKSDDSFDIIGLPAGTGNDIVAGDVFVIQGQSNAEAWKRDPPNQSANGNQSQWIRTFGTMQRANNFLDNLRWEQAQGDGPDYTFTVGQWGLKLAKLLIDDPAVSVPIAVFNGAQGNTRISQHLKDADPILSNWDYNIYERLFIRLDSTHLRDKVRAIFWSQGENDGVLGTTTQGYINLFDDLKNSWLQDYINVKRIYIFQSKNGCDQSQIGVKEIEHIKEAQRLIAVNDNKIHLMQTALPTTSSGTADYGCHFTFINGYEEFANRIFKLIDRDFYGGSYSKDIEPPMPLKAYLISSTSLVVETDAIGLSLSNGTPELNDFFFNGGSASINSVQPNGNKMIIGFTGSITSGTTLTYKGLGSGENLDNFIVNTEGLELVCFDQFPIDDSLLSIWNGEWSPAAPLETMDSRIDADYTSINGSIITRNLEVSTGVTVNFDNDSNNNIIVYGDMILNGNLIVGDTESLLMKNTSATITGGSNFTKKEKTTPLKNMYAVTYFSSSVNGANLSTVFDEVDPNRIFLYDPKTDNSYYTGAYIDYRHWHIASGTMVPGRGYAVDGPILATYPDHEMEVSFTGDPNYKDIGIEIGHGANPFDPIDMANLVGNPYPAAIDADLLIAANSGSFQETLYLWGHTTEYTSGEYSSSDYFAYNEFGSNYSNIPTPYYIASGQGFMIMTDKPNRTFRFENSMMIEGKNDMFYKSNSIKKNPLAQRDRFWLKFSNKDNIQLNKEILIGLSPEASSEIDHGYDARLYTTDSRISFYSSIAGEKFAIQALNIFSKDILVPLGFTTSEDGYFTIELIKSEGKLNSVPIFIYDSKLDVLHDLIKGGYMFQSRKGEFNDRFVIKFGVNLDNVIENDEEKLMIDYLDNGFRMLATKKVLELRVFDIMGRLLFTFYPNESSFEIMLPGLKKGSIIFLQAMVDGGKILRKKAAVP